MSEARDKQADLLHMRRALRLAPRGRGAVEPNPMVGCVIVKHGRIIGEGYHRRFGGPHAEIEALRRCRDNPRNATAYVTLEPCCHFGKTPPCTAALIEAGVRRVVAAMRDPNPSVAGRGLRQLRRAGLAVECGLLAREAAELNAPYLKLLHQRRPWVILKWAQSLDGKIAARTFDSKWISDESCRAHAHRVRGLMDAIIVGRHTVETDDPELTARHGHPRRVATRIVLDANLRTPRSAKLAASATAVPTWILCKSNAPADRRHILEDAGCRVFSIPFDGEKLALDGVLNLLGRHRMTNVLVEGGGELLGSFADLRLADEIQVYIAPLLVGGRDAVSALGGTGCESISQALRWPPETPLRRLGNGWFLQARLKPGPAGSP